MRQPSSQFLRLLYGAPLGQFLRLLCGPVGAPRSVYSHPIWRLPPPLRSVSLLIIWSPLRSVSSHTIWRPLQVNFFAYYMYVEAPLDNFLRLLYGAPLWSVSSLTIWGPAPQINLFASYVGASSDQFLRILYRGPPQVICFAYKGPSVQFLHILYGPPSDQFLCFLCGGLFRSVSSHTI